MAIIILIIVALLIAIGAVVFSACALSSQIEREEERRNG